jgi:hypothetical protein
MEVFKKLSSINIMEPNWKELIWLWIGPSGGTFPIR